MKTHSDSEPERLTGELGVFKVFFTVLAYNAPIAVGAAFAPLVIGLGNQGGAPTMFVVIGALLVMFSVGLTTMARYLRRPGAFYVFVATGLSPSMGIGSAFAAVVAYVLMIVVSITNTGLFAEILSQTVSGPDIPWWIYSLGAFTLSSAVSLFNLEISAKVLAVSLTAELITIAVWIVAVAVDGGPEGRPSLVDTVAAFPDGSIATAFLFGILCILGFEAVTVFRDETRDPDRTVARTTYLVAVFLTLLFAAIAYTFITSFGLGGAVVAGANDPAGSFTASFEQYLGSAGLYAVAILLVPSSFAAQLALQNIAARYLFSLARDRALPLPLARVSARHGSPRNGAIVVIVAAMAIFLVAVPSIGDPVRVVAILAGIATFLLLAMMAVTNAAILRFFHSRPHLQVGKWRSLIAPVFSQIGFVTAIIIATINMDIVINGSQMQAIACLVAVGSVFMAGIGVGFWMRKLHPEDYEELRQRYSPRSVDRIKRASRP